MHTNISLYFNVVQFKEVAGALLAKYPFLGVPLVGISVSVSLWVDRLKEKMQRRRAKLALLGDRRVSVRFLNEIHHRLQFRPKWLLPLT